MVQHSKCCLVRANVGSNPTVTASGKAFASLENNDANAFFRPTPWSDSRSPSRLKTSDPWESTAGGANQSAVRFGGGRLSHMFKEQAPPSFPTATAVTDDRQRTSLRLLRRTPLVGSFSDADLLALEIHTQMLQRWPGDLVHGHGDDADYLFILATGAVKISRPSRRGQDVVFDIFGPPAVFGAVSGSRGTGYPDTATALTHSQLLAIPAAAFRAMLETRADLALGVLDELAHRHERAQQRIRRLSSEEAGVRIAARLLELADTFGEPRKGCIDLPIPLTRADLAALTGVTPETASRVMSRLRADRIVDSGRCWTMILDRRRLAAAAGH